MKLTSFSALTTAAVVLALGSGATATTAGSTTASVVDSHEQMLQDVIDMESSNNNNNLRGDMDFNSGASDCQVAGYLRSAGFPSNVIPTMVCVAKYESSFNCGATNRNVDGSTDYGLFQINSYYWCSGDPMSKHDECHTSCSSLFDCNANARCAKKVYSQQGLNAWYAYQSHRSECDNYKINC